MKTYWTVFSLIIILALAGATIFILNDSQKVQPAEDNSVSKEKEVLINIQGFAYSPKTITLEQGAKVTWTNMDSAQHTVTSSSRSELNSQTLGKGESYSHTFQSSGTFEYYCTFHPNMNGKVIVE